ncbi:MAG: phosphoglucosamine mutase [Heliobacteriaceae bacterium]|nr:phosphoglucosamine mutase [Heliobacteriaceae bacterium]MDD4588326.1 phosphoglucosamine mutase [Heliobacteriaceae bacterium]
MGRLFGTDGVRGVANRELTPELAYRLGRAGAFVLKATAPHPRIVIGKDTRLSGDMLEGALVAGITSVGGEALAAGVLPTPGVACLTRMLGATAGIVISASHNPVEDNGIKFFAASGFKLPDAVEAEIEQYVFRTGETDGQVKAAGFSHTDGLPAPTGAGVGRVYPLTDAANRYIAFLRQTVSGNLKGFKIVVDGANGAAAQVAPRVLQELGAEVTPIFCQPDGTNINAGCGSTHPEALCRAVRDAGADLGLAYDGDADRLIAVDENGQIVDGDQIMATCALHLHRQGRLVNNLVAVTVMSNLGLHQALQRAGIKVVETTVGDRYVLEALQAHGGVLGGEQSGHILFLNHNTTGDGILTSLQLLSVMQETGRPLSALAGQMERYPQVLVNVRVKDKQCLEEPAIKAAIAAGRERLSGRGRILVRPSGTEPLIRVMGEGPDPVEVEQVVATVAAAFERFS